MDMFSSRALVHAVRKSVNRERETLRTRRRNCAYATAVL